MYGSRLGTSLVRHPLILVRVVQLSQVIFYFFSSLIYFISSSFPLILVRVVQLSQIIFLHHSAVCPDVPNPPRSRVSAFVCALFRAISKADLHETLNQP